MGKHTDIIYHKDGICMSSQNSKSENTSTVIITIGVSRKIKWQKRTLINNPKTDQYS